MLIITNLTGESLPLRDIDVLARTRGTNGDYQIKMIAHKTERNKEAFDLITEESIITLPDGNKFRVKAREKNTVDKTVRLEVTALHTIYDNVSNYQYDIIKGEKVLSLHQALTHAFEGTDITFYIEDEFDNHSFENFGDDNSIALFNKIKESFELEFKIENNTHLRIYKRLGKVADTQLRYKHNIKTIKLEDNTHNLSTYIKGYYGDQQVDKNGETIPDTYEFETEYTSPSAEKYGILHAKPYKNEKIKHENAMQRYLKSKVIDEPEMLLTVEHQQLINNLSKQLDEIELGDTLYLIHEPMDIQFNIRINEVIDFPLHPQIKPIYTLSTNPISLIDNNTLPHVSKNNNDKEISIIKSKQTAAEKRIEKTIEAVADVENAMIDVDKELERIENEVIPSVEQAVDSAKIPTSTEPPYPIPTSNLWWDSSINPPRLKRWNGTDWVVLAPTESEIDDLIEQMRQEAIQEGITYTDAEIQATKQAIQNKIDDEIKEIIDKNLIDISNIEQGRISPSEGDNIDHHLFVRNIEHIKIDDTKNLVVKKHNYDDGLRHAVAIFTYDKNLNYIGRLTGTQYLLNGGDISNFTLPNNTKFVRFEFRKEDPSINRYLEIIPQDVADAKLKLEKGEIPSESYLSSITGKLGERITTAETNITLNSEAIELKAEKSELTNYVDKQVYNNKIGELDVAIDNITGRVESTEVDFNDFKTGDYNLFKQQYGEFKLEMDNFTTKVGELSSIDGTLVDSFSEVKQEVGLIESTVRDVRVELDELEIGGRNLILHTQPTDENVSKWISIGSYTSLSVENIEGLDYIRLNISADVETGNNARFRSAYVTNLENGKTYTASWKVVHSNFVSDEAYGGIYDDGGIIRQSFANAKREAIRTFTYNGFSRTEYKYTFTFTFNYAQADEKKFGIYLGATYTRENPSAAWVFFRDIQLEEGNKATAYRPSYEDTNTRMTAVESTIKQLPDEIDLSIKEGIGLLELGGTNLVLDSEETKTIDNTFGAWYLTDRFFEEYDPSDNFIISFEAKADTKDEILRVYTNSGDIRTQETVPLTTNWKRYEVVADFSGLEFERIAFGTNGFSGGTNFVGHVRKVKIEKGTKSTDWSPAPEDGVAKTNVLSSINLSTEGVKIEGAKIDIKGVAEFMSNNVNLLPMHPSNWENGYISISGGKDIDRDYSIRTADFIAIEPNTEYTLNNVSGANIFIREFEEDGFVNNHPYSLSEGNDRTFTTGENSRYIRFYWSNSSVDKIFPDEIGVTYKATFVKGSTPLSWEDAKTTIINGGRIVTNNITANQLNVDNIFGNSAVIAKIQADSVKTSELDATQIKTGTLDAAKANLINVSASSITTGTLDGLKARIKNIDASEINSGVLNAINITGSIISGGRLQALNNNTNFNLNTGQLTIGNGADIEFEHYGNRLYYNIRDTEGSRLTRSAGMGVGRSINDRFPYAFLGTSTGTRPHPRDDEYFVGFIANTNARITVDGIGNSSVGDVFQVRDNAVSYNKGFEFDLRGSNNFRMRPISSGSYSYWLGASDNQFSGVYTANLRTSNGFFTFRNSSSSYLNQGFRMDTTYDGDDQLYFRGIHSDDYHSLGRPGGWRFRNLYLRYQPDVSSDERLKTGIKEIDNAYEIINAIEPIQYRYKLSNKDLELKNSGNMPRGLNINQYGFSAQQVKKVLDDLGIESQSLVNLGEDNYYGMQTTQIIPLLVKAFQEEKQRNDGLELRIEQLEQQMEQLLA